MNLQDLCRMQNIFYYRQKIPLGLIVQTWLFFFFLVYLLCEGIQEGSWVELQISGTGLIEDC